MSRNIWSWDRKRSGRTKKRVIFGPAPSYLVLPCACVGTCELAKEKLEKLLKQRAVMPEEEDTIDKACVYLLEHRYPDGCSGNAKRIIRRKAETLAVRDGEVFYLKARKDSDGKKVFHEAILS